MWPTRPHMSVWSSAGFGYVRSADRGVRSSSPRKKGHQILLTEQLWAFVLLLSFLVWDYFLKKIKTKQHRKPKWLNYIAFEIPQKDWNKHGFEMKKIISVCSLLKTTCNSALTEGKKSHCPVILPYLRLCLPGLWWACSGQVHFLHSAHRLSEPDSVCW